jgi:uncharacterized protein YndB with AHSA1/START domain
MALSQNDCVMTSPEMGMVIAVAVFPVDTERLFRAFTEPAEISHWWGGQRGGSRVVWRGHPEAGKTWQAEGQFAKDRTFSAKGTFIEIERPSRFVQSWQGSWDGMQPTEVSLRFEQTPQGTALSLVHRGFEGRDAARLAQAQIWWKVIKWLRLHFPEDAETLDRSGEKELQIGN